VCINSYRHSGRDCRKPEAMDGGAAARPCVLDPGNPAGMTPQPLRSSALLNRSATVYTDFIDKPCSSSRMAVLF
ncbi:MAG: hypothetical protein KGZ88_04980, partial [Methylomicrobium sp.]|nr:hypothetical protein [Methylomicrobium sp.]